jgi:general stress protein YciG
MAGTRAGGTKAARTNKLRYRAGGRKSRGGGFAKNPDLARMAGRKGGLMSRRRKSSETTESAEQA